AIISASVVDSTVSGCVSIRVTDCAGNDTMLNACYNAPPTAVGEASGHGVIAVRAAVEERAGSPRAIIHYHLPDAGDVRIALVDVLGHTLVSQSEPVTSS